MGFFIGIMCPNGSFKKKFGTYCPVGTERVKEEGLKNAIRKKWREIAQNEV